MASLSCIAFLVVATALQLGVYADINVVISTETSTSGNHEMVIDGHLRQEFGLGSSESDLRNAVGRHTGRTPNNAYVKSPASNGDWEDLYTRYNWPQVMSTVTPSVLTDFRETADQRVVIASSTFSNSWTAPVMIRETLTHTVEDVVEKSYSGEIGLRLSHSFNVGVIFVRAGYEIVLEAKFGYNETRREASGIGASTEVSFELLPGQAVVVDIVSSLKAGQATIRFDAALSGWMATNFNPTWEGSHFWGLDVSDVLEANGQPSHKTVTQTIKAGYYMTKSVVIRDPDTNKILGVMDVPDNSRHIFIRQHEGGFYVAKATETSE